MFSIYILQHPEMKETFDKEILEYKQRLLEEKNKQQRWKEENIKRRHNYVPFLVNLLKVLAEKKELLPLVDKAKANVKPAASK